VCRGSPNRVYLGDDSRALDRPDDIPLLSLDCPGGPGDSALHPPSVRLSELNASKSSICQDRDEDAGPRAGDDQADRKNTQ